MRLDTVAGSQAMQGVAGALFAVGDLHVACAGNRRPLPGSLS
jgi:hypothetical protein